MQRRHLAVALLMLVACGAAYELYSLGETSTVAADVRGAAVPALSVTSTGPPGVVLSPRVSGVVDSASEWFDSMSDATVLFTTGATLLVIAAGVRRVA